MTEEERDLFSKKYRLMEIAVGLLQVAIVLASASIITGVLALLWVLGGLGAISLGLLYLGSFFLRFSDGRTFSAYIKLINYRLDN